ncbi:hypothetical protein TU77_22400 [Pseudomonas synxantha]|nr:hypothetical protein TU77_22400 [Pseudomonas synxantha]
MNSTLLSPKQARKILWLVGIRRFTPCGGVAVVCAAPAIRVDDKAPAPIVTFVQVYRRQLALLINMGIQARDIDTHRNRHTNNQHYTGD